MVYNDYFNSISVVLKLCFWHIKIVLQRYPEKLVHTKGKLTWEWILLRLER